MRGNDVYDENFIDTVAVDKIANIGFRLCLCILIGLQ